MRRRAFHREREPPDRLREWYADHLGVDLEDWGGAVFRSGGGETLVWAVFAGGTDYFGSQEQQVQLMTKRADVREIVGEKAMQELIVK